MNVHVPRQRIVPDACPCLPTNSGQHPFGWSGPFAQPPCSWTSGKVAASRIEEFVTPSASGLSDWQGESKRSNKSTRNKWGGTVYSGAVGAWDNTTPALWPE